MFARSGKTIRQNVQHGIGALDAHRTESMGFVVEDTYWGYIVRSTARTPVLVHLMQGFAFVIGVAMVIATLGLWLMPDSLIHGPIIGMKFGASTLTTIAGGFLLWFASRGTATEIHVDTRLAEVREVVTNRAGRPTLLSRHGFDIVAEVAIDAEGEAETPRRRGELVIRSEEASALVKVASGSIDALDRLRQRLRRDLMVAAPSANPAP
ncbi:MAG: hypothetical protein NXI07_14100, partial [bacterium]|nr:hypothetical protein [bacterium]